MVFPKIARSTGMSPSAVEPLARALRAWLVNMQNCYVHIK